MTNGLSHPYHLGDSTFIFRGIRSDFSFLFHFSMKLSLANRIAPDGMPRFVASHLGLFCLPMSHKNDVRLIRVNTFIQFKMEKSITSVIHLCLYMYVEKRLRYCLIYELRHEKPFQSHQHSAFRFLHNIVMTCALHIAQCW